MASQSLYRKWRSQTFSDLIGQEAVVRTLLNAVREGRLAHAYLFCGPRGTGKTSAARLLAKAVNCTNPQNGEPCNECVSCREITAGRSPDVIEIDAASNTGVDNIRDLRETVNLLGSGGRHKVYVIDETHMLSTAAFNALLKTLEEPPPHIIFVLATTEAHKVLPTVVSRCQRFDFRRISMRNIVERLQQVAEGEGLTLEPAAADLLARAAQGGMRDALSLLDQAMAFCGAAIDLERTRTMLGLADPGALRRLIEMVADGRSAEGIHLLNELVNDGADLRQLNAQLAEEWRALTLARAGADIAQLLDRPDEEARELTTLASRFTLEELTACARIFSRNDAPARGLPVPQLALELAFLECLGVRRNGGAQPVVVDAAAARPAPAQPVQPPAPRLAPPAPALERPAPRAVAQPQRASETAVEELDLDAIERGVELAPPARPAPAVAPAASLDPAAPEPDDLAWDEASAGDDASAAPPAGDDASDGADAGWAPPVSSTAGRGPTPVVAGDDAEAWLQRALGSWELVKQICKQKSRSIAALLHAARPGGVEWGEPGTPPVLVIYADYQFHLEKLREPERRAMIEWALSQALETPMRVRVALSGANGPDTPPGLSRRQGPGGSPAPGGPRRPTGSNGSNGSNGAAYPAEPASASARPQIAALDSSSGYVASNGRGAPAAVADAPAHTSAPAAVRDASAVYTPAPAPAPAPLRAPTPIRPDVTPVPPTAPPDTWQRPAADARPAVQGAGAGRALEDAARGDSLVQALMRAFKDAELAEVRPLDADA